VLAYVFWHRPLDPEAAEAYEQAQVAFHRSLARTPPAGFVGSACYRAKELPWLGGVPGYEDWYLVEDYAALGVLNEAAVGRGHRTSHDEAARRLGAGAGGLYGLIEGHRPRLEHTRLAVWIARAPGVERGGLCELLGDGMDPERASLWRRQLVLGPAPEFCVLAAEARGAAAEAPQGVAEGRLPRGWQATSFPRETLV
jgi:hypothetical protein